MAKVYGEIASSGLMTFDKSFSRSNGQPLDSTELFYSLVAAQDYAKTDVAYVGQKIVVIETKNDVTTVTHYGIESDNTLKELGSIPVGDGVTIEVVNGKIQLAALEGHTTGTYQPFLVDGKIEWRQPSATTVEGLDSRLTTAEADIDALEAIVGQEAAEGVEASGLVKAVAENASAITAVDTKIGTVAEGKTVIEMIADAQAAATYDDTDVKAGIEENKDAIALLNDGSTVEGSVDYKIAQAVAAIMENPDETKNSINELVTWINDHAQDALELSNKVTANEEDIAALEELVGTTGVADQITAAIEAALKIDGVDKYALATDLTAAIGRIAAMEANVEKWNAAEQNAKNYADGIKTTLEEALEGKVGAEEGKSLVADTLIAKLEGIAEGAQVNAIDTVDETQFGLTGKHLTLLDIAISKVTGLQDALDGKASKGTTLAEYGITDTYTKTETEERIQEVLDGLSDTSETAASVAQALETYKTSNDARVDTIEGKLKDIADGAQVNVLEGVKVGGTLLEITDKTVDIPVAAATVLGVVMSSDAENKVAVAADGTMEVNSLNVKKLVQDEDEFLVLDGGAS